MGGILKFLLPVALLVIGIQVTRDYFGDTSKEKRNKLKELISNGQQTTATLKNEYTEKTIKIAGVPIKTYEVGYTFKVGEKEFSGTTTLKEPPTESEVNVKYLADNPSVNAANPEAALADLDKYEGSTSTLLIGVGLVLAGLGLGFFRFRSFKKSVAA